MDAVRAIATVIMWVTYLAMVFFAMTTMGGYSIFLAFVLMIPLLASNAMMWSLGGNLRKRNEKAFIVDTAQEKRKREHIDAVLRDLSSDDLLRLKQRLSDGTLDADYLQGQLDDELSAQNQ